MRDDRAVEVALGGSGALCAGVGVLAIVAVDEDPERDECVILRPV